MKNDYFEWLLQNYINGNIEDCRKSTRGMSKKKMIKFIYFLQEFAGKDIYEILEILNVIIY